MTTARQQLASTGTCRRSTYSGACAAPPLPGRAARETEVRSYDRAGVSGTLAAIAQFYERSESHFSWVRDMVDVGADSTPPLTDAEIAQFRRLLRDEVLLVDEADSAQDLLDPTPLPSGEAFRELANAERDGIDRDEAFADVHGHEAFLPFLRVPPCTLSKLLALRVEVGSVK